MNETNELKYKWNKQMKGMVKMNGMNEMHEMNKWMID